MEVSYDLFLLMFNLSLLHNREKMIDLFVAGMQEIFKPSLFLFNEKAEKSCGINFELKTGKSSYGIIIVKSAEGTEKIDSVLIGNAVHMLAIMLERLYLEQSLEKERDAFENLANLKIDELKSSVKDLEEARTVSINLIEDLSTEIEKRKLAEDNITKAELYYRSLIEKAPDGIVLVGLTGNIVYASPSARKIFGYTGKDDILPDPIKSTHPLDTPRVMGALENIIKNPSEVETLEYRFKKKDGIFSWVESTFSNQYSDKAIEAIIINFRNIDERKRAEDNLRRTQIVLKATINSPKGMVILAIDKDYNYLSFNDGHKAAMKSAYGKDVTLGMNLLECITSEEDIIISKENYGRALRGESHSTIQEYGDKVRSYFETNYNPIYNEDGEIIGTTAFAKDITDRKEAENKILDQLNELRRWNEVTLDREDRILELKKEVNELMIKNGNPVRYESAKSEGSD